MIYGNTQYMYKHNLKFSENIKEDTIEKYIWTILDKIKREVVENDNVILK